MMERDDKTAQYDSLFSPYFFFFPYASHFPFLKIFWPPSLCGYTVILEAWEIMSALFLCPDLSFSSLPLSAQSTCEVNEIPLEQKLSHSMFWGFFGVHFYGCISFLSSWTFFLVFGEIKNELIETFEVL